MMMVMKGNRITAVALAWLLSAAVVQGQTTSPTTSPTSSSAPTVTTTSPTTNSAPTVTNSPTSAQRNNETSSPTTSGTTNAPTLMPTTSSAPTSSPKPSSSTMPSLMPTLSPKPSNQPTVTMMPSLSSQPTEVPSVSVVPSSEPSAFPTSQCYSNLTEMVDQIGRGNGVFPKTYILCKDTVFNLGSRSPIDGACCVGGDSFLMVKSKNTILCGSDGKSSNNCIFRGGENQFIAGLGGFFDFRVAEVLVKGITFEGATLANFVMNVEGSVKFQDCIFRKTAASSPILAVYQPAVAVGIPNPPGEDICIIHFDNCTFEEMSQGTGGGGILTEGIVTAIAAPVTNLIFTKCIFRNNFYPGSQSNPAGYAISSPGGSSVEVRDSCFYNNTWAGWAPIRAFSGAPVTQDNNFMDDIVTTTCNFIAKSDKPSPDLLADVECLDAALNQSCPLSPANEVPDGVTDGATSSAFCRQVILSLSLVVSTMLVVVVAF